MTQHRLAHTIVFAWVLIAFAGSAKADIAQCIDEKGLTTFTDTPCDTDVAAPRVSALINTPAIKTKVSLQIRKFAAAEKARVAAWANKRPLGRRLPVDVATLEAGKVSLVAMDHASALLRQQALAEQGKSWTFWRS